MIKRVYIGIDPDVEMSGIGRVDKENKAVWCDRLSFPLLIEYLRVVHDDCKRNGARLYVFIESTRQTTHNWHLRPSDSKAVAAVKGRNVGAMQEVGKLIAEMCEYYGIEATERPPLRKCWQGKEGKITHEEIAKITGLKQKRSNQEGRDALLIAWVESGLPIRISKNEK